MECVGTCWLKGLRYGAVNFIQNVGEHRAYGLGEFRESVKGSRKCYVVDQEE